MQQRRRGLCWLLGLLVAAGALGRDPPDLIVVTMTMAGGASSTHRLSGASPLPVETEEARIEAAGFEARLAPDAPGRADVTWSFVATIERSDLTRVRIWDMTVGRDEEDDPAATEPVLLVDDPDPKLLDGRWKGLAPWVRIDRPRQPAWFWWRDTTVRIFRFELVFEDDHTAHLDQLAFFDAASKKMVRKRLKRMGARF